MRVFSPLSFLFGYERAITFATVADVRLVFSILHLIFHFLLSFDHL